MGIRIFLCGFMGAGKSLLLSTLKRNSQGQFDHIELDQEILRKSAEKSIARFVEKNGWEVFRKAELSLIQEYCFAEGDRVVSLGGGALCNETLQLIQTSKSHLVWLATDFDECWTRIKYDSERPLVEKGEAFLRELYREREKMYGKAEISLAPCDVKKIRAIDDLLQALKLDEQGKFKA